jgi:hypothetical protein
VFVVVRGCVAHQLKPQYGRLHASVRFLTHNASTHHYTMAAILPLHLPDHLPTLLISTVGFAAIHHLGAPEFARFLLGKKGWDALGSRDRVGWYVFFPLVSLVLRTPRSSLAWMLVC